jgi:hypothetical protein
MPNWVHNQLSIPVDSEHEAIAISERFKSTVDENNLLTFEKIIPRPPDEEDWYHWQIANWGTKWDATEVTIKIDDKNLRYDFSTAWSPPLPILAKLSEIHPKQTLRFVYEEEQGWGGVIEAIGGQLTQIKEWNIPSCHADYVDRGGECWCDEEQSYSDCFYERAKASGISDQKVLEAVKSLGIDWSESYDRLLEVAQRL